MTFSTEFPLSENDEISSFLMAQDGMHSPMDTGVVTPSLFAKGVAPFAPENAGAMLESLFRSSGDLNYMVCGFLRRDTMEKQVVDSPFKGRKNLRVRFTLDIRQILLYTDEGVSCFNGDPYPLWDAISRHSEPLIEEFPTLFEVGFIFPYCYKPEKLAELEQMDISAPQYNAKGKQITPDIDGIEWEFVYLEVLLEDVTY